MLTPRTGDRVLVSAGPRSERANTGEIPSMTAVVVGPMSRGYWAVTYDDLPSGSGFTVSESRLTVLDRDPVEWPRGWALGDRDLQLAQVEDPMNGVITHVSYPQLNRIRGPEGDYVAEHWDDLMGDK